MSLLLKLLVHKQNLRTLIYSKKESLELRSFISYIFRLWIFGPPDVGSRPFEALHLVDGSEASLDAGRAAAAVVIRQLIGSHPLEEALQWHCRNHFREKAKSENEEAQRSGASSHAESRNRSDKDRWGEIHLTQKQKLSKLFSLKNIFFKQDVPAQFWEMILVIL